MIKVETISFKTEYAEKYGMEAAILIQGIQLGLSINANKKTHNHHGKVWMYNSIKDWHRTYPFMSESTIKRALGKLKELGIIKVMQLDSNPMNKTNWYTLTQPSDSKQPNPLVQDEPTHQVNLTQSNGSDCTNQNNIKQTVLNNNIKQQYKTSLEGGEEIDLNEAFEQVWKAYNGASTRQVGSKSEAKKKFLKLSKNELEALRVNLPIFIKSLVGGGKADFFPNLTTYLNQKRYLDEKPPVADKVAEFEKKHNNWFE